MPSVAVNPPKTPVTKGSSGIACATLPNVCKMPGPPAPVVPTPLPNVGRSGDAPIVAPATVTQREFSLLIKACHAYAQLRSFVVLSDVGSDWAESLLGDDERVLSRKFTYELALLKFLAPHSRSRDAIVVLPLGWFDDHEWGLMGVGPESRVMSERLRGLGYDCSWTGELSP